MFSFSINIHISKTGAQIVKKVLERQRKLKKSTGENFEWLSVLTPRGISRENNLLLLELHHGERVGEMTMRKLLAATLWASSGCGRVCFWARLRSVTDPAKSSACCARRSRAAFTRAQVSNPSPVGCNVIMMLWLESAPARRQCCTAARPPAHSFALAHTPLALNNSAN